MRRYTIKGQYAKWRDLRKTAWRSFGVALQKLRRYSLVKMRDVNMLWRNCVKRLKFRVLVIRFQCLLLADSLKDDFRQAIVKDESKMLFVSLIFVFLLCVLLKMDIRTTVLNALFSLFLSRLYSSFKKN